MTKKTSKAVGLLADMTVDAMYGRARLIRGSVVHRVPRPESGLTRDALCGAGGPGAHWVQVLHGGRDCPRCHTRMVALTHGAGPGEATH